jgi:hypothetical protein
MRVFLIILGILMLLPGACGFFFTAMALSEPNSLGILAISLPSLAVGVGGLFLIRHAARQRT